jgi:hypothetical protein
VTAFPPAPLPVADNLESAVRTLVAFHEAARPESLERRFYRKQLALLRLSFELAGPLIEEISPNDWFNGREDFALAESKGHPG